MEQARGDELGFGQLVAEDAVAAADVDVVVRAHVTPVSQSQRQTAAAVGVLQERIPGDPLVDQPVLNAGEDPLAPVLNIRVQRIDLVRLLALDDALTRLRFRRLRVCRGDTAEQGQRQNAGNA